MPTKLANPSLHDPWICLVEKSEYDQLKDKMEVRKLVDRFLAWSVPTSVRPDNLDANGRMGTGGTGTNLLSADEARQMFEFLFGE